MSQIVELVDLIKSYVVGDERIDALRGINLAIGTNEYVAFVGSSGSGKSTLMNVLGCLDTPTSGRYFLNGHDVASMSEARLAEVRNREIGFVFQSFHLLPRLTALQNVMQPLIYRSVPRRERIERGMAALDNVGLGNRQHHLPNQLSGGQKQRVAVARALCGEPSMLLADEPTGNLDSVTSKDIMGLFDQLHARGQTIVIVTHESDIANHCHRAIRLDDGAIVSDVRRRSAHV